MPLYHARLRLQKTVPAIFGLIRHRVAKTDKIFRFRRIPAACSGVTCVIPDYKKTDISAVKWSYSPALDQLRFFAAGLVCLRHYSGFNNIPDTDNIFLRIFYHIEKNGSFGVSIFLVLSAFLFTMNCRGGRRPIQYSVFIKKRIARIFPMYIIIMLLLMTQIRGTWTVLDFLTFLFMQVNTGNPMTGFGHAFLPIGPIWTIGVEFQFYLIFPLLIAALPTTRLPRLILFISVFIVLRVLLGLWSLGAASYYNCYHTLLGRADQFMIGIICAELYMRYGNRINKNQSLLILISTLSIILFYMQVFNPNYYPLNAFSFTIEALLSGGIICSMQILRGLKGILGTGIANLGKISYSFYLLHLPVGIIILSHFGDRIHFTHFDHTLKTILLVILPATGLSILTYHSIEVPFMRLASRKN